LAAGLLTSAGRSLKGLNMVMTIGQVAKQAGVNVQTIRYYERRSLVPAPPRARSGYRQYVDRTAIRVRFIREAARLGFSLREIRDLLALRGSGEGDWLSAERKALGAKAQVEAKIRQLRRLKRALERLMAECRSQKQTARSRAETRGKGRNAGFDLVSAASWGRL
jgi:MerR family copper efflux transcriptional regulator